MEKNNDMYSWISERLKERGQNSGESGSIKDTTSKDEAHYELKWLVLSFGLFFLLLGGICIVILVFQPTAKLVHRRIDPFREVSDLHKQGMRYAAQGDFDKAIDCFTEAIPKARAVGGASFAGTYYAERGKCYEAIGDLSAAMADYNEALKWNYFVDERSVLLLRFAEQEIQKGNIDKAISFYSQSLDIDDYSLLEWGYDFNCRIRLRTYNLRIQALEESADPLHQYLRQADSLWREITKIYMADRDDKLYAIFSSFGLPDNLLLGVAEWHYGQANYVLALECLNRLIAHAQYSHLPPELQKACQELKESLTKLLQSGFPAGALSHTSRSLGITVSCSRPSFVAPMQDEKPNTETDQN